MSRKSSGYSPISPPLRKWSQSQKRVENSNTVKQKTSTWKPPAEDCFCVSVAPFRFFISLTPPNGPTLS